MSDGFVVARLGDKPCTKCGGKRDRLVHRKNGYVAYNSVCLACESKIHEMRRLQKKHFGGRLKKS